VPQARKWATSHGYRLLKAPHVTRSRIRLRIVEPGDGRKRLVRFGRSGVEAVLEFPREEHPEYE
jgi:hypothetical protein